MRFAKLQATGNDFVVLDARQMIHDWSRLAIAMCDRHFGIGADGLLVLLTSKVAELRVEIFNPDGSEAEICGNGLVCLAKYIVENDLVEASHGRSEPSSTELSLETKSGVKELQPYLVDGKVIRVRIGMGHPHFKPSEIPVLAKVDIIPLVDYLVNIEDKELLLTFISMGNPHAVYFTDKPVADFPLSKIGPCVEHHPLFPQRVNFEVANVLSKQKIAARFWERGAGETLACGSGACAIGVAARLHGWVENKVDITSPGGNLGIEWDGAGEVFLTGSAESVFTGEWLERP